MLGLSAGITGPTDTLQSVTVTADKGIIVSRADTIKIRSSQKTSDILLGSSALILSDYGGPSGTKNISLRGLGIAHTSIYIDGIRVNNVQNGQSDLGLMDAQLYSRIVIDYAQNSVNFVSSVPELGNKKFQTQISTELGSWETYSGAAQFSMRLSPGITARISARGTKSAGNYEYGAGLTRTNADHQQISAQADLYGSLYQGRWQIKAHYGNNDRGTPGAISWPSQDRQSDIYSFLQGYLNKRISEHYNLTISAKASQDKMLYLSEWGDSDYKHNNLQLNSSHQFYINDWWNASVATDLSSDKLNSSGYDAQRTSVLVALASAFRFEHLYADISLEYNGTFDKDALSRNTLSPAINLRYVISEQLSAMGFVRRASRVPTFNELYYVGYGNPELKAEDAILSDLGVEWNHKSGYFRYKTKFNLFYNLLTDKITSAPTKENPNIWLPYNIGRVEATGADLLGEIAYHQREWSSRLSLKYTGQNALDKTKGSDSYNQQISYVCRHNISLSADASYKKWTAQMVWNYRDGRRDSVGALPAWNTLNITLSRSFLLGKDTEIQAHISGKNLLNCRYEIVRDYPMPGRNIIGGINIKF